MTVLAWVAAAAALFGFALLFAICAPVPKTERGRRVWRLVHDSAVIVVLLLAALRCYQRIREVDPWQGPLAGAMVTAAIGLLVRPRKRYA